MIKKETPEQQRKRLEKVARRIHRTTPAASLAESPAESPAVRSVLHEGLSRYPHAFSSPEARWQPRDLAPFVQELRRQVRIFRSKDYPEASPTSVSLLRHWFNNDTARPFRYWFAQREAMETLVYLFDVKNIKTNIDLLHFDPSGRVSPALMKEDWRRYVVKMATGSGKTKVMSLAIAWSYFHKLYEQDSSLARNFLLIAPNIIVMERLYKDFAGSKIFTDDAVIPENGTDGRNWQDDFHLKLYKQKVAAFPKPTGNLFLSNIQRLYRNEPPPPSLTEGDRRDYFFGKRPSGSLDEPQHKLLDVVRNFKELTILNDEAHHIHDEQLVWFQSIQEIQANLKSNNSAISLQLDTTATPRDSHGKTFVQTITDYPLVEAIHQGIVKHPVLPDKASREKLSEHPTVKYVERYKNYIDLGVKEWRKAFQQHAKTGKKAVLFVMCDDTHNCDDVAKYLSQSCQELRNRVLVIHTKDNGDFKESIKGQKDLERARKHANNIDEKHNRYRAVVSVMMLKEGWDVKNVTTIVGLRAFSAKSNILPEQTIGRGLRLMYPDKELTRERVSVIGTKAFIDFVEQVKEQGVQLIEEPMSLDDHLPSHRFTIEIDHENNDKDINALDIKLPVFRPRFMSDYKKLAEMNVDDIACTPVPYKNYEQAKLLKIRFQYALEEKESHTTTLGVSSFTDAQQVIGYFVQAIVKSVKLFRDFDLLYPKVQAFIERKIFGKPVPFDRNTFRNLSEPQTTEHLIKTFAQAVKKIIATEINQPISSPKILSVKNTSPFLSYKKESLDPHKSPFNKIVWDSNLERDFAYMLGEYEDVLSYTVNYHAIEFSLEYLDHQGMIHNYYPDFLVKLEDERVFVVELKGQEGIDARPKFDSLKQWCEDANKVSASPLYHSLYLTKEACEISRESTFTAFATFHQNNEPSLPSQTKTS